MNEQLFIVCSFYTSNTPYVEVIKKYLFLSLNKTSSPKKNITTRIGKRACFNPKALIIRIIDTAVAIRSACLLLAKIYQNADQKKIKTANSTIGKIGISTA